MTRSKNITPAGPWLKAKYVTPKRVRIGELADQAGVTRHALYHVFRGTTAMTTRLAFSLGKALGVSPKEIMVRQIEYELQCLSEAKKQGKLKRPRRPRREET